jgi:uncharacterized protein YdhG (YjbR/CyaY superfamily)
VNKYESVEEYLAEYKGEILSRAQAIRDIIKSVEPDAIECISYNMPAYKIKTKPLVYFAIYDHHIGFYATPTGHEAFAKELSAYKQGKGSVQFPHSKPLPIDLIKRIVAYRKDHI